MFEDDEPYDRIVGDEEARTWCILCHDGILRVVTDYERFEWIGTSYYTFHRGVPCLKYFGEDIVRISETLIRSKGLRLMLSYYPICIPGWVTDRDTYINYQDELFCCEEWDYSRKRNPIRRFSHKDVFLALDYLEKWERGQIDAVNRLKNRVGVIDVIQGTTKVAESLICHWLAGKSLSLPAQYPIVNSTKVRS